MPERRLSEWFWLNLRIGALSFGGAGRSLLYRQAVVDEQKWLTPDEFQEVLTIAQLLPGPNLVNIAAYMGFWLFGTWGAVGAIALLSLPGAVLIVIVLALVPLENPVVSALFRGFSLASVLLFALFIARLVPGLRGRLPTQSALTRRKAWLRFGLATAIAIASLAGAPLLPVLGWGITVALAIEFSEGAPSRGRMPRTPE